MRSILAPWLTTTATITVAIIAAAGGTTVIATAAGGEDFKVTDLRSVAPLRELL
jgi:hypothetical protein